MCLYYATLALANVYFPHSKCHFWSKLPLWGSVSPVVLYSGQWVNFRVSMLDNAEKYITTTRVQTYMYIVSIYFGKIEVAHNSINYTCRWELECGAGSQALGMLVCILLQCLEGWNLCLHLKGPSLPHGSIIWTVSWLEDLKPISQKWLMQASEWRINLFSMRAECKEEIHFKKLSHKSVSECLQEVFLSHWQSSWQIDP